MLSSHHLVANADDIAFAQNIFVNTPQTASNSVKLIVSMIMLFTIALYGLVISSYDFIIKSYVMGIISILIFFLPVFVKWIIVFHSIFSNAKDPIKTLPIDTASLPIYSIIVPLYKESLIFPDLKKHIEKLQYPSEKLDILILLEEDDSETIQTVTKALDKSNPFKMKSLIIPKSQPQTKPKAMNIALNYIKGEYFVIYDAEDRPDPDQILKAVQYFKSLSNNVGALQAKLSFYNQKQTLFLTRLFTLEYEIWFNHFLPGLIKLGFAIPLSGTSTHMRTKDIFKIGGWDSYNVTEDCDLGMRLASHNMKVKILDSTTHEEAVSEFGTWIKQRTRWMKGYLQTLVVHTQNPINAYKQFGLYRLLGIYAVVGGQFFSALLHPISLLFTFLILYHEPVKAFDLPHFMSMMLFFLYLSGFVLPVFQAGLTVIDTKKNHQLAFFAALHSLYWLMAGFACYRALYQLILCPFKWEKTPHGQNIKSNNIINIREHHQIEKYSEGIKKPSN